MVNKRTEKCSKKNVRKKNGEEEEKRKKERKTMHRIYWKQPIYSKHMGWETITQVIRYRLIEPTYHSFSPRTHITHSPCGRKWMKRNLIEQIQTNKYFAIWKMTSLIDGVNTVDSFLYFSIKKLYRFRQRHIHLCSFHVAPSLFDLAAAQCVRNRTLLKFFASFFALS